MLIFILYPKTPHAQNAHLFDPGHVCSTFRIPGPGTRLTSGGRWAKPGSGRPERTGKCGTHAASCGREAPARALPVPRARVSPGGRGPVQGCRPHAEESRGPSDGELADSRLAWPGGHVGRARPCPRLSHAWGMPGSGGPTVREQVFPVQLLKRPGRRF